MTDDLFYPPVSPPWHKVVQAVVAKGGGIRPYRMWGHLFGLSSGALTDYDLFWLAKRGSDADTR